MLELIYNRKLFILLIVLHFSMGLILKFIPSLVSGIYIAVFLLFALDIIINYDSKNRAGFYAMYIASLEIVYRMSGALFSWELGKYLVILLFITGLIMGKRKVVPWGFLLMLLLLLPALFFVQHSNPERIREMILFNVSGPLSLVFAGLYFYCREIDRDTFFYGLRLVFLPAFSLVSALTFLAAISTLEFSSLQSSYGASAGFGPNQVSTLLGWFLVLGLLFKIVGKKITPYEILDWVTLFVIFLRALLTFSRGGVVGALLAIVGAVVVLSISYPFYRKIFVRSMPWVFAALLFFAAAFVTANEITGNYLLYRYMGYTTSEVVTGIPEAERSFLTGRGDIMKGDFAAFKDKPLLGVGYGMGERYRSRYYWSGTAHTEFARLLSENGIPGIVFMVTGMIVLPLLFFIRMKDPVTRCFFTAFFLLSMFTMFHAAMRLALPGVVFGAAFICINSFKKEGN
ncbi:O-antigen ligase family protein [Marinilabiliaceae bacterium ANBcel2]|nr:O-antigen ligase family protein [Marinilabiliaceae bacterium ANBcel2]